MNWSWLLPESASTFGGDIDGLYYLILWITGAIFVLVEVALVVFIIKYRHREGRVATYSHGSKTAEIIWTVIPFILVLFIAFASNDVWLQVKRADQEGAAPPDAYPLRVVAKQFEWNVTYPGPDGRLDTDDDFVKRNQLHVPVNRAVRIDLESEDVIHSFFLPEMRVKQDAMPGMTIPVWFEATQTGEYPLACAELCGLGHYRMRASLTVHETRDFERWMAAEMAAGDPAPQGADAEPSVADDENVSEGEESA
ncbi:MAG: cytochrome c oxidase subunit II [Xanthomonadales bacterium]|nr:cytochrome c oxidase subunit II [Xanthomonadales bacterium]